MNVPHLVCCAPNKVGLLVTQRQARFPLSHTSDRCNLLMPCGELVQLRSVILAEKVLLIKQIAIHSHSTPSRQRHALIKLECPKSTGSTGNNRASSDWSQPRAELSRRAREPRYVTGMMKPRDGRWACSTTFALGDPLDLTGDLWLEYTNGTFGLIAPCRGQRRVAHQRRDNSAPALAFLKVNSACGYSPTFSSYFHLASTSCLHDAPRG